MPRRWLSRQKNIDKEKVDEDSAKPLPKDLAAPDWSGAFEKTEEASGEGEAAAAAGGHLGDSPAVAVAEPVASSTTKALPFLFLVQ